MIKEKIILAPGASEGELLRTLAKNGTNTIGTSVVNAERLAEIALDRSGITCAGEYITRREAAIKIDSFISELGYYENVSFADSEALAAALFSLREQIPEAEIETVHDKLPQGEFQDKNRMLREAYDKYMDSLERAGQYDYISKIRLAIETAEPIDVEIVLLEEFPLSILEKKLAEHLSGGKSTNSNLIQLAKQEKKPLTDVVISDCYGASNEVRDVLSYIYENKIPFDECTIAVTDVGEYSQLFNEIGLQYKMPMVFGCGISINTTNPARLLNLYTTWVTEGYKGVDGLREMLLSGAFDKGALKDILPNAEKFRTKDWQDLAKEAGYLRLNTDKEENDIKVKEYLEYVDKQKYRNEKAQERAKTLAACVEILAKEFQQGVGYWIEKYSKIRKSSMKEVDLAARTVICNEIAILSKRKREEEVLNAVQTILAGMVDRKQSLEGSLLITGIKGALSAVRPYLFVVGLSSDKFPGTPTENPLMLDSDYYLFGEEGEVPSSFNRVEEKEKNLRNLLGFATSLGSQIRLSFPSFSFSDVKELNPSATLFEVFKEINGEESLYQDFISANRKIEGFFQDKTSRHWRIGASYAEGNKIELPDASSATPTSSAAGKKAKGIPMAEKYSPTAIGIFFSCPRRFYLKYVLGLSEPEEDNPSEVIHANEKGTLIHELMELNGAHKYKEDEFMEVANTIFSNFLKSRPPLMLSASEKEKKVFLELANKAYKQEVPGFKVLLAEERIEFSHPTGITVGGYPDRIEEYPDGSSAVVDFKSGRNITQKENDVKSCLQGILYARGIEEKGIKVSRCEFRYPNEDKVISCEYGSYAKTEMDNLLTELKEAFGNDEFNCTPSKEACKYCGYIDICGKETR